MGRGLFCLLAMVIANASAQSWQRVQGIDSSRSIHSILVHDGIHYAAGDSLVYRSTDGLTWLETVAQPVPGAYPFGLLASHSTGLYLGTSEDGVRRTTDGGATWTVAAPGLPDEGIIALARMGDSLFAGLNFSAVYLLDLKTRAGWVPYSTGLTQFGSNSLSVVGDRLYAGLGLGFYVRARGATEWTVLDLGVQRQVYEVIGMGAARFAVTDHGVYRADSDTSAWVSVDIEGMRNRSLSSLAVRGDRLYAGLNYSGQHWIWSTDNLGATWDVRAHEFAELWDLRIEGNRMWAARQDGLWTYELEPVSLRRDARSLPNPNHSGIRLMDGKHWRNVDGRRVRAPSQRP